MVADVVILGHGYQQAKHSWLPLAHLFEGSGEDQGHWTDRLQKLYDDRLDAIATKKSSFNQPLAPPKWCEKLCRYPDCRRASKQLEEWSKDFLVQHMK